MATWKKILTKDSAVGSDGLLFLVTGASAEGATLRLSDGTTSDDIELVAGAGIDFSSSSEGGFTIQVDTSEITAAIQGELTDALLQASGNASAVTLTLTGPGGETDTVEVTGGTGINFGSVTAGGFTIETTEEDIEDIVGGMLGGTNTGITITYQDITNDIDFVVDDQTLTTAQATNDITVTMSNPTTNDSITVTAGSNITLTDDSNGGFTIAATDTNTQLSDEAVQDIVGAMVSGNTESGISVDYQDLDGTLDFTVADQTLQSSTSNTDNVTLTLSNPGSNDTVEIVAGNNITLTNNSTGQFTIDASATASNVSVTDSDTDETAYLVFTTATSGSAALKVDSSTLQYNASSDTLTVNNLTVAGTQTTVNTTELVVADKNIVIADGSAAAADANGAGITVDIAGTLANMPQFLWNNGGQLTGWTLSNYNAAGNTDFPVSAMEFDAVSGAPGSSDNAAGVGSFHMNTADGKLYIRTA